MRRTEIAPGIYASPQPSEPEIHHLAQEGIRSIVNLRTGDSAEGLSPADEARLAEQAGLTYVNLPMRAANARPQDLDKVRSNLTNMPKPVLVHCRGGRRSAMIALTVEAAEQGRSGDEAVERARELGIDISDQHMERLMREYVGERRGTTSEPRTAAIRREGTDRPATAPGGEQPRTKSR